ncbi:hypothetical protein [Xanthomonas sp. WHRI 7945]
MRCTRLATAQELRAGWDVTADASGVPPRCACVVRRASRRAFVQRGRLSGLDVLRSVLIVTLEITLEKNGDIADSSTAYLACRCATPAQARRHRLRHRALRSL